MNMKNIVLSAFLALGTLSLMAAESQQQPEVGKAVPDFSLTTGDGSQVSLKDHRGKWVVLYFYPKDFTSGCTLEAHNFQRDLARYEEMGAVILGVSVDSADSHKSFCESALSTLTPRITAPISSYLARSRWKLCASSVHPLVKSLG